MLSVTNTGKFGTFQYPPTLPDPISFDDKGKKIVLRIEETIQDPEERNPGPRARNFAIYAIAGYILFPSQGDEVVSRLLGTEIKFWDSSKSAEHILWKFKNGKEQQMPSGSFEVIQNIFFKIKMLGDEGKIEINYIHFYERPYPDNRREGFRNTLLIKEMIPLSESGKFKTFQYPPTIPDPISYIDAKEKKIVLCIEETVQDLNGENPGLRARNFAIYRIAGYILFPSNGNEIVSKLLDLEVKFWDNSKSAVCIHYRFKDGSERILQNGSFEVIQELFFKIKTLGDEEKIEMSYHYSNPFGSDGDIILINEIVYTL